MIACATSDKVSIYDVTTTCATSMSSNVAHVIVVMSYMDISSDVAHAIVVMSYMDISSDLAHSIVVMSYMDTSLMTCPYMTSPL
jgi:hypothetical protein